MAVVQFGGFAYRYPPVRILSVTCSQQGASGMTINDRFTRGWIAGALGSILGSIWSFLAYQVGFTTLRLSDWSAILIYGRIPPFSLADEVYATIVDVL